MDAGAARRLSLPAEHGGYLTVVAATAGAALLAPAALPAAGAGLAVAAGFLARGPVERLGNPHGLRVWDRQALLVLAAFVAGGAAIAGSWLVGAAALAVPAAALVARRLHAHRATWFELAGMAALGLTAALAAWSGAAPMDAALVLGIVLGAHSAAAVPLVRTQLRRKERGHARVAGVEALAVAACGALLVALIGHPLAALALAPRGLQAVERLARGSRPPASATAVGVRETVLLAVATVVAVIACS
jgi:hypothetical protein